MASFKNSFKRTRKRSRHRLRIFFKYHFQRSEKKPIFVVATRRSGSNLLISYLNSIPDVSFQNEVLNADMYYGLRKRFLSKKAILNHIVYSLNDCPSRICGIKTLYVQLESHGITVEDLKRTFPSCRFVILYRKSLLDQFISLKIAQETHHFLWSDKFRLPNSIHIDPRELRHYCKKIKDFYRKIFLYEWLENQSVIISYEELIKNTQKVFNEKVFPILNLVPCVVTSAMRKQNTKNPSEIVSNYEELKPLIENRITKHEYHSFDLYAG